MESAGTTLILLLPNLNDKSDKNAVIAKHELRQFEHFLGTATSPSLRESSLDRLS
jgi:hypothetical protein